MHIRVEELLHQQKQFIQFFVEQNMQFIAKTGAIDQEECARADCLRVVAIATPQVKSRASAFFSKLAQIVK